MTDILQNLRPKNATSAAIREAVALLRAERVAVQQRLAEEAERRPGLLLTGTTTAIRSAEQVTRDDELNLTRLNVLEAELTRRLTDATVEEAAAAHGEKVRDAIDAIEAFNAWMVRAYLEHATAIAGGVELERQAWRAAEALRDPMTKAMTAELPVLALAYVGLDGRGLGFLTRLPAVTPGPGIVWP